MVGAQSSSAIIHTANANMFFCFITSNCNTTLILDDITPVILHNFSCIALFRHIFCIAS